MDSALIAKYLVHLIKDKRQQRQIIFATHNANFVVNGDSELINILNVEQATQITKIEPITIENKGHRNALLSLEGGKTHLSSAKDAIVNFAKGEYYLSHLAIQTVAS